MTNIRCGDETFIVQHADLKFVKKKNIRNRTFWGKNITQKNV